MRTESEMRKDLHTSNRRYFFNAWTTFASSILLLCIVAPISMGDFVTWATWAGCVLLVYGARAYQYFIQKR